MYTMEVGNKLQSICISTVLYCIELPRQTRLEVSLCFCFCLARACLFLLQLGKFRLRLVYGAQAQRPAPRYENV
jgi:hypothetical protein